VWFDGREWPFGVAGMRIREGGKFGRCASAGASPSQGSALRFTDH
jgi:hypothetical protein